MHRNMSGARLCLMFGFALMIVSVTGGIGPSASAAAGEPLTYIDLSVDSDTGCAVVSDGTVRCWGSHLKGSPDAAVPETFTGQHHESVPVRVKNVSNAVQVAVGSSFACAVIGGGEVECWDLVVAADSHGLRSIARPAVAGIDNAVKVDVDLYHGCALLDDGQIKCWGSNIKGQLGNGVSTSGPTATLVGGIADATDMTTNQWGGCAVVGDGVVKCWGWKDSGEFDPWVYPDSLSPKTSSLITRAVSVVHRCALLDDQLVSCWDQMPSSSAAVQIAGIQTGAQVPVRLSGDGGEECLLYTDGSADCWLSDSAGAVTQLIATSNGADHVVKLELGYQHYCVLLQDGRIQCWGKNDLGQLGDGTTTDSATPVDLVEVTSFFKLAEATNASLYRLYSAYFLRNPDGPGFEYWLTEFQANGVGLDEISDLFALSEEFDLLYGDLGNSEFLDLVYANVMERSPDAEGHAYWLGLVENAEISRGDVMLYFAESQEFRNRTDT